ncbi:hypothetical protein AAKU67_001205 [Oxalobacteraceae bacterium GrIS 2.11]
MNNMKSGIAIATAAAAFFAFGGTFSVAQAADAPAAVHCAGINSCKGTSDCKSASNECKGQNKCKGMGWVSKTAAECSAAKGTVVK